MVQTVRNIINKFSTTDPGIFNDNFILRILENRANQLKLNVNTYYDLFVTDKKEAMEVVQLLHISYSRFFRNPMVFEYIASILLPQIYRRKVQSKEPLRIWSAACATGEEPYTIAMIIDRLLRYYGSIPIHIMASDINSKSIDLAGKGEYTELALKNVKYTYFQEYFIRKGNRYAITDYIKEMVTFTTYDVCDTNSLSPPESIFAEYDLILCRNLMIYLNEEAVSCLFHKLHRVLNTEGYMLLGNTERVVKRYKSDFEQVVDFLPLYKKSTTTFY